MEVKEHCLINDFSLPGPRPCHDSVSAEYNVKLMHSFHNNECDSFLHYQDILIPSDLVPSDFIMDLRSGLSVSSFCARSKRF